MTKQCTKCKKIKDLCDFFKRKDSKIGLTSWCKSCKNKWQKKYNQNNLNNLKEYRKKWEENNLNYRKEYKKKWKDNNPNYQKKYNQNNKEKIKKNNLKYRNNKRKTDPRFKLKCNVSSLISTRLKNSLSSKKGQSTFNFLPYTIDDLIKHLEQLFTKGMSWDNYGEWHIDHIKPDSLFNYKSVDDEEFQECWALENLQPLWAEENLSKSNKY